MVGSFNIDGANLDTEFDDTYDKTDNLICPDGLSFTNSSSNNSNNNNNKVCIINHTKRINKDHFTVCISSTNICNEKESKSINNSKIIDSKHRRWWLKVPVEINKRKKLWIRMLGDSAADKPCANLKWAWKHFRNQICKDSDPVVIHTGGGTVNPEYCIWLSFPTDRGITYSSKFVLLKDLPAPILADLNILDEFGYKFKDEIPPVFRKSIMDRPFHHPAQPDMELDIKEGDDKYTSNYVDIEKNWRNLHDLINKNKFGESKSDSDNKSGDESDYSYNVNNISTKSCEFDKIKCLEQLIFSSDDKSDNSDWKDDFYFDKSDKYNINCNIHAENINTASNLDKNYQNNFITMKPSLMATESELREAEKLNYNKKLKETDLSYLKLLEKWKPRQYAHLYERTIQCREKWKKKKLFAEYTCDRRTLNVEPCGLGIKPEHRNSRIRIEQYPLNREKRIQMIGYTTECDKNGFWLKIECSVNNNPHTMIVKAPDLSGHRRGRPVFDFRELNALCELMVAYMPTMKDFREFFANPGLMTTFDFKNYFDCIPMKKKDWIFAVISTPLGLRKMTHLSYGFKNAAPHAQRIMNDLCTKVPRMIGYVDDGALKHPLDWNTDQLIAHLEKLFEEVFKIGFYLHPEKFYPFCTEVESLGIRRTMYGSSLTKKYIKKVLAIPKPVCVSELRSAIGVLGYISRYIMQYGYYSYWLLNLVNKFKDKEKIDWDNESDQAWSALMYLVENAPILYHPTVAGKFAVKSDACIYAWGGVLYQHQQDRYDQWLWRMIDMCSQIMPKQMRKNHCKLHEAYGFAKLIQHWSVYLLRNRFIVSTDHQSLLRLFKPHYDLSAPHYRRLLRIRLSVAEYDFVLQHVRGIDTQLADSLSRLNSFLVKIHGKVKIKISGDTGTIHQPLNDSEKKELELKIKQFRKMADKVRRDAHNVIDGSTIVDSNINNMNDIVNIIKVKNSIYKEMTLKLVRNVNYNQYRNVYNLLFDDCDKFIPVIANNNIIQHDESIINDFTQLVEFINKNDCDARIKLIDNYNKLYSNGYSAMAVQTRSMTRRQQRKQKSKMIDIDSDSDDEASDSSVSDSESEDNNIGDPVYVEVDEANLDERRRLRDKLLNSLFDKQKLNTAFNYKLWPDLQRSDEELKLVIMYLQKNNKLLNDKDSVEYKLWQKLKKDTPELVNNAVNGNIKFSDDNILVIKRKNELNDEYEYVSIVPAVLRGRLAYFAHNNPTTQHYGQTATRDNLTKWFWWPGMRADSRLVSAACPICQAIKGGPVHRHSFATRTLPEAKAKLLADFMGPFFKKYYILVLIDYCTGFTVLAPCTNCGAIVTSEAIINKWFPYFGLPIEFDSDLGSAFISKVMKTVLASLKISHKFAEPRYHNRIGKVERAIGFIQQILRSYNVQFDNRLVTHCDPDLKWSTIEAIIPFIQFGINKKRSRISTFSPAMLMLGEQFRDIPDIVFAIKKIKSTMKDKQLANRDYNYLNELQLRLKKIRLKYKQEWKAYCKISKRQYDVRYNLAPKRDKDGNLIKPRHKFGYEPVKQFIKGAKVLYYAGPHRPGINSKWRQKWTGPWYIANKTGKFTVKIVGNNGKGYDVDIDRLKLFKSFKKDELMSYPQYEKLISKIRKDKPVYSDDE